MLSYLLLLAVGLLVAAGGYALICRIVIPAACSVHLDEDGLRFLLLHVVTVRRIPYVEITGAGKMARRRFVHDVVATAGVSRGAPVDTAVVITRRGGRGCIALSPTDPDRFIRDLGEKVAAALRRERTPMVAAAQ